MKKICVVICLLLFVVFVGQVNAHTPWTWTEVEGSSNDDFHMKDVQLPSNRGISLVGIYKNNGNPLMEIKIWNYGFSIIYNATDMTIWGMIFPGAVPGSDALGGSRKSNDITILRKGITKTKNCFSKCCDFDKIHIQHIEDEETGWCPFQINLLYDCNSEGNKFRFAGKYWGIINFRGPPNFFDSRIRRIYMKRFVQEGNKAWSETTCITLNQNYMRWDGIGYTIDPEDFSLWRRDFSVKYGAKCNFVLKNGTPEDHNEPGTAILIYEGNDTVVYKFSSQD